MTAFFSLIIIKSLSPILEYLISDTSLIVYANLTHQFFSPIKILGVSNFFWREWLLRFHRNGKARCPFLSLLPTPQPTPSHKKAIPLPSGLVGFGQNFFVPVIFEYYFIILSNDKKKMFIFNFNISQSTSLKILVIALLSLRFLPCRVEKSFC